MIDYNPRFLYCWVWKFLFTWHDGFGISFYPDYENSLFHLQFTKKHISFGLFVICMYLWLSVFDYFVPNPIINTSMKMSLVLLSAWTIIW